MRALLLALFTLAVLAPAALADDFDKVFKDYSGDGRIDPCKHTAAQLQRARKDVPPDIDQYAPDFPEALEAALEARARGKCASKKAAPTATTGTPAAPAPPAPAGATGAAAPSGSTGATGAAAPGEPPAPAGTGTASAPKDPTIGRAAARGDTGDGDAPAPRIGLAVLAALALVAGAAYGLARWRAWNPPWALRARHAAGEAGYRVSATWAEFTDWLRLGR